MDRLLDLIWERLHDVKMFLKSKPRRKYRTSSWLASCNRLSTSEMTAKIGCRLSWYLHSKDKAGSLKALHTWESLDNAHLLSFTCASSPRIQNGSKHFRMSGRMSSFLRTRWTAVSWYFRVAIPEFMMLGRVYLLGFCCIAMVRLCSSSSELKHQNRSTSLFQCQKLSFFYWVQ